MTDPGWFLSAIATSTPPVQDAAEVLRGLPGELEGRLTEWGLGESAGWIARLVLLVLLGVVAVVLHFVERHVFARLMERWAGRTETTWDDALVEHRVYRILAHLIPALFLYFAGPLVLHGAPDWQRLLQRAALAYLALIGFLIGNSLLSAGTTIYERRFMGSGARSIRSYVQVLRLVLWFFAAIVLISVLMDRSPWALLGGLGALTAVLMLVFKDSILGFVASVQIAGNDMVRVGDWIEMPDFDADGDVIEISLTTVKVQNWNKTISTIPTYALVSHAFKNWRGMSESEGRRIKRAIWIDLESIRFAREEDLERWSRVQFIQEYLDAKKTELREHNERTGADLSTLVNGRHLTNVGTFRAYVDAYLRQHPRIHQGMTRLVRQLPPTEKGLGIEIYAFSSEQRWGPYEGIQADIFDHLFAVLPEFDLRAVQVPTGADVRAVGGALARA